MLTKIKRQDCLDKYQVFPTRSYDHKKDEEDYFYPKVFNEYILTFPSKSFKRHITILGKELLRLTNVFQADRLIFLGDTNIPWLHQNNDYKPVKEAQAYLIDQKIGRRFTGALEVNTMELPTFVRHLAWLTRCNAALPYFHFIDSEQNFLGHICQYGSLHLEALNEETDKFLSVFLQGSKMELGDQNSCYNRFDKTDGISGRQIVL